jgi:hypothetical protein
MKGWIGDGGGVYVNTTWQMEDKKQKKRTAAAYHTIPFCLFKDMWHSIYTTQQPITSSSSS